MPSNYYADNGVLTVLAFLPERHPPQVLPRQPELLPQVLLPVQLPELLQQEQPSWQMVRHPPS